MERSQARFEKRKTSVAAILGGDSIATVARVLKVPKRTLFEWISRYRAGGEDALREGERSGRPRKVSAEVMEWLYDAITLGDPQQYQFEFCLWTLNIVRALLKKLHKIELSKSSVSRLLNHLGLSPQRPMFRSYKQDPAAMNRYLKKVFPQLRALAKRTGATIYFVDESAIRSDAHRGTTWGKIGETPIVYDSGSRFGLNLISAVSPRGDMFFKTFDQRMDGNQFVQFLKDLRSDNGGPIIVIADNASYHRSGVVKDFVKSTEGAVLIHHLPPYAPELNPDEQVWNHAKARLTKLFITSKAQLLEAVAQIMTAISRTSELIRSFFRLKDTLYADGA